MNMRVMDAIQETMTNFFFFSFLNFHSTDKIEHAILRSSVSFDFYERKPKNIAKSILFMHPIEIKSFNSRQMEMNTYKSISPR